MRPIALVSLVAFGAPALSGCVAGMAMGAVGAAAQAGGGNRGGAALGDEKMQAEAREGCSAAASQHGEVQINLVQQRSKSEVIVMGMVEGEELKSFECRYGTKVDSLTLRAVAKAP